MEPVFLRFNSYDFEADQRFQDGLKTIHEANNKRAEAAVLDLKLFFYNRFVEPIDRTSYKQWSSVSPHEEQLDQRTLSDSVSATQTTETSEQPETNQQQQQLSFAEVMRLVQEGKEVPGVEKLDIKPSNQSPTPSQMQRLLKPWEVSE
ncbi:uncharacterized protein V6R79_005468 [Siganus canaliculatus]